jgi:chitosanase
MPSQVIPCVDCADARARFERLGFVVRGCESHPTLGDMCVISFDPPAAAPAAGPLGMAAALVPAAAPAAALATAATGVAATPSSIPTPLLTDTQSRTAKAIVNLFETGHLLGDYGQVTVLPGDSGRLTYGRSQTTLGSGKLGELLRLYAANPGARFAARVGTWLPAFAVDDPRLDTDVRLHNLLRACADDPVMRETQDAFFDTEFWQPALRAATKTGVRTALGTAVVYDSLVHGSWTRLRDATTAAVGTVGQAGEQVWIERYVSLRRQWLATHSIAILRNTVYRMDAFQRLIDLGQWGLALPLVVRGAEISTASLAGAPPGCYDGPASGSRVLAVQQPLLRGLDVRRVQLALSDLGADIKADGVFGNASARSVREVQIARGMPVTGVADIALIGNLVG